MTRKSIQTLFLISITVFAMGAGLPGCPGNKAMEEQVEQLQTKNADTIKKIASAENQLKMMTAELAQYKTQIPQIIEQMNVLKGRLDQLETQVREMAVKATSHAKPAKGKKQK